MTALVKGAGSFLTVEVVAGKAVGALAGALVSVLTATKLFLPPWLSRTTFQTGTDALVAVLFAQLVQGVALVEEATLLAVWQLVQEDCWWAQPTSQRSATLARLIRL
jgi:hypothetical protein